MKLKLSKQSEATKKEVMGLRADLVKLQKPMEQCLADDKGDLDKIGAELSTLRAKVDILQGRVARKERELFPFIVTDVNALYQAMVTQNGLDNAALKKVTDDYVADIRARYTPERARAILADASLVPIALTDAQRKADESRKALMEAMALISSIDEQWHFDHMPTDARTPQYAAINNYTVPEFFREAMKAAGLDMGPEPVRAGGTRVTGLAG